MSAESEKNKQKDIANNVLVRVNQLQEAGGLDIPKDYSAENALKGAWLYLQSAQDKNKKPVLEVCDNTSIANALFEMVIEGLSVVKKQCYFIAYGTKLECQKSYFGNLALAKRICGIKAVKGAVIYEGDKKGFKYEVDLNSGRKKLISHAPSFDSIDNNKIAGAYAIVINEDGTSDMEIMAMKDIRIAWNQGSAKGNSPAHKNFPDQMAIKTVMNRAVKIALASSDDKHLGLEEKSSTGKLEDAQEVETIEIEASKPEVVEKIQKPVEEKADKKGETPDF
jgi:recombination protein RecT